MRNDSTVNKLNQESDLIGIENNKLGKDPFRPQPGKEFGRRPLKSRVGMISPIERLTASGLSSLTRRICSSGL